MTVTQKEFEWLRDHAHNRPLGVHWRQETALSILNLAQEALNAREEREQDWRDCPRCGGTQLDFVADDGRTLEVPRPCPSCQQPTPQPDTPDVEDQFGNTLKLVDMDFLKNMEGFMADDKSEFGYRMRRIINTARAAHTYKAERDQLRKTLQNALANIEDDVAEIARLKEERNNDYWFNLGGRHAARLTKLEVAARESKGAWQNALELNLLPERYREDAKYHIEMLSTALKEQEESS